MASEGQKAFWRGWVKEEFQRFKGHVTENSRGWGWDGSSRQAKEVDLGRPGGGISIGCPGKASEVE